MSLLDWNGTLHDQWPADLALAQRALYYGDGLFESIRVFDSKIPYLSLHLNRLFNGLATLGCTIPAGWDADFFENAILRIAPANARVRLSVWRKPGGLYLPTDDSVAYCITAAPLAHNGYIWPEKPLNIGLSTTIRLPIDILSNLKAPNALRYVAAAKEAQSKGWDDALLLNSCEQVCEATISNLFWISGGNLYTPPLSDGCVAGVMRQIVLTTFANTKGLVAHEQSTTFAHLYEAAEEIFLTNAIRGIIPVASLEGKALPNEQTKRIFHLILHT